MQELPCAGRVPGEYTRHPHLRDPFATERADQLSRSVLASCSCNDRPRHHVAYERLMATPTDNFQLEGSLSRPADTSHHIPESQHIVHIFFRSSCRLGCTTSMASIQPILRLSPPQTWTMAASPTWLSLVPLQPAKVRSLLFTKSALLCRLESRLSIRSLTPRVFLACLGTSGLASD